MKKRKVNPSDTVSFFSEGTSVDALTTMVNYKGEQNVFRIHVRPRFVLFQSSGTSNWSMAIEKFVGEGLSLKVTASRGFMKRAIDTFAGPVKLSVPIRKLIKSLRDALKTGESNFSLDSDFFGSLTMVDKNFPSMLALAGVPTSAVVRVKILVVESAELVVFGSMVKPKEPTIHRPPQPVRPPPARHGKQPVARGLRSVPKTPAN